MPIAEFRRTAVQATLPLCRANDENSRWVSVFFILLRPKTGTAAIILYDAADAGLGLSRICADGETETAGFYNIVQSNDLSLGHPNEGALK